MLALAVAFVGVLATLMTVVAERRRDLAIRSALGASPGRLVWTIVGQGACAHGCWRHYRPGYRKRRGQRSIVVAYRVSPLDATTFAGTALLIGGGALLTTYFAALRTRGVDPLVILGHE